MHLGKKNEEVYPFHITMKYRRLVVVEVTQPLGNALNLYWINDRNS